MQLRVFMLGLGAALVAGTIWFPATGEDSKGFVQQASAQPPSQRPPRPRRASRVSHKTHRPEEAQAVRGAK
jgi:hypothetical protein